MISVVTAATVDIGDADMGAADIGDADMGAAVELVLTGATQLVQIVLVLVLKMVDTFMVLSMDVTPFETFVLVTGQLVIVV